MHCTRPYADDVSTVIQSAHDHVWPECHSFLLLYSITAGLAAASSAPAFIDAGSNIGACTLFLAAHGIPVFAFEPNPANLFYLTQSLAAPANSHLRSRVALYPLALGERHEQQPLFVQRGNAGNSVLATPVRATQAVATLGVCPRAHACP